LEKINNMSHTVEINSEILDVEMLKKTFNELNWNIKENTKIRTYRNDPDRDRVYDLIAVNPRGQFDIGIQKSEDRYKLFGDFYDRTIAEQLGNDLGRLKQRYLNNVLKKYIEEEDVEYTERILEDGTIELELA
jgi:Protein of unknown function (DUF1257)